MSEEIDKHVLKRYDVGQKLGKGAYGIVWKAVDKKSQKLVALKKVYDAFQVPKKKTRTRLGWAYWNGWFPTDEW
jgi:mitogen-activated protein kinase 15